MNGLRDITYPSSEIIKIIILVMMMMMMIISLLYENIDDDICSIVSH